jgi:hypothetical protein
MGDVMGGVATIPQFLLATVSGALPKAPDPYALIS